MSHSEDPVKDYKYLLKEAAIQVGSGGSAGFIEVCIMHPLDLIKTRFQLQATGSMNKNDPRYYNGIVDCFRKMYKHEGVLAFYKGILPPIFAETPKRATKFFCFEQYKKLFLFGSPVPTPLTFSLAGLGAGVTEAILVNPFEVVKVTMQANQKKSKESPSTWATTRKILREDGWGFKGLNKGLSGTIWRNGMFNLIYFGFYHSVKELFPVYDNKYKEFFKKVLIGFTSGCLASCVNIPFDVAKSRIQGPQPVAGQIKYHGCLRSVAIVYKEEGFRALYKGLLPKVLRLGPGGAIMLVVFDYMHVYLHAQFM